MSTPRLDAAKRRFSDLLQQIFQLDTADLDFGIYRILALRKDELQGFLGDDLLPQVEGILAGSSGDRTALLAEREALEARLAADGLDTALIERVPKWQTLTARLREAPDISEVATRIFADLSTFFARYYDAGDFLPQPRYKGDAYAIPYDGSEVKLHWANSDQYYVKSSETHSDYRVALGPTSALAAPILQLRLCSADTDLDNNKSTEKRRYVLRSKDPVTISESGDTLTAWFEYRQPKAKGRQPNQRKLNDAAERAILEAAPPAWRGALSTLDRPGSKSSRLRAELRRYTQKNTSDYFIHKDLGAFLRRELDFFIKNDVLFLDDLEARTAAQLEATLQRTQAMRAVGHKIIDWLDQVESFQRRLFLKRPFVLRLDRYAAERAGDGWTVKSTAGLTHPQEHLEQLAALERLAPERGLLVQGEAFRALRLLGPRLAGRVQCVYMDPPFNTGSDGFLYKDQYAHSSWLTMMDQVLAATRRTMTADATLYAHIDYTEKERLKLLLDTRLDYITEIIWRIGWISGYKSTADKFIRNHDTIYQYGACPSPRFYKHYIPYPEDYVRRDGKKPTGKGYPIEDTWNCSDMDALHSIQIVSFSREKVGDPTATQKNEALLHRMLRASSAEGDLVLDPFGGTGTTAATAHKTGRRWVSLEMSPVQIADNALPRLVRVLEGDRYGVSKEVGWSGGGGFDHIELETFEDTLENISLSRDATVDRLFTDNPGLREDYTLRYLLQLESKGSLLALDRFRKPWDYTLHVRRDGVRRQVPVDLVATFSLLLGLEEVSTETFDQPGLLYQEGLDPDGERVGVVWRDCDAWPSARLEAHLADRLGRWEADGVVRVYVNGDQHLGAARAPGATWTVHPTEEAFQQRMFDTRDAG